MCRQVLRDPTCATLSCALVSATRGEGQQCMRSRTAPPDATQERHTHACEALHERDGVARVSGEVGRCSSLMPRAWLNLGATSSSSSAARTYGWLTAPHESQAHGSPVCNGASNETHTREWLPALSETPQRSRAGDMATGNKTSTQSWLQPVASAQPTTNSSTAPMGERRAWMAPQAYRQQMDGSNRSRSWL